MTERLAILADDFTGACDAAAPFAAAGASTLVTLGLPAEWPAGADVLAVDLDARAASDLEARRRMAEAAARLRTEAQLFVKIDSTLRGPVAALIEGALEGSLARHAVVAPAFPEQGRVYVNGVFGTHNVREALGGIANRCRIEDDLSRVLPESGVLLAGAGGLARRLAGAATGSLPKAHGTVLVVSGSPAPETHAQLQRLPPGMKVLRTPPATERDAGEAAALLARAAQRTNKPGLLVLTGGQTARLVCETLGVHGVRLLGEVQPGIP
ncbi:MAG TPA: four-carbon acid sugar kinase family protein, partial [Chloroflexota bacterium]|nr:four-carbon acid sugar kinase family protein [Chloroflexota bacterium]